MHSENKKSREEEKLFEFKTDEGNLKSASVLIPLHPLFMFFWSNKFIVLRWWTEQVVDGLDRAVLTMKKGEVALLTIAPDYAFGTSESQQELAVVPPNSAVYFEVELVSFEKVSQ